jgi:LytS/YehU family sensor histidine kinase
MLLRFLKPAFFLIVTLLLALCTALAQQNNSAASEFSLPREYSQLQSDTARMRFLVNAITDSLNEDQLAQVYNWAKTGLAMAEKNKVDTMKGIFNYFMGKAFTYSLGKPDSAIVYYKKVIPYFPDRNRKYNAFSIREIMERYSEMGNKDSSFVYLDTLKAFIDTMPETSGKRISLSQNIATVYQWFGMFKTAISYYQIAVNGDRKNGNVRGLGLALANLGELYDESGDDVKALQYSKEALEYLADVNRPYMQTASNVATYYKNLRQFDSALVYYNKAVAMAKKLNDAQQLVSMRTVLGEIYLDQGKLALAEPLLKNNITALIDNGNRWTLAKTYLSIASLDSARGYYSTAKENLLKGLQIAKEDKQEVLVLVALQSLAHINAKLGDYKAAFDYQNEFLQKQDSMTDGKTKAEMADLEISYQTLGKEQKIKLLQQENDIKNLQLKNSERSKLFYLALLAFAITLFSIVLYQRSQRNKITTQKIKAELQTQILRSQMNPHFIFNCLNSIENFIMQNNKRQASDYLNKFSLLIRSILDSSRNEVVPIEKDMEALQLYVELEQLRFNNKFSFKVAIDPALAGGDYQVPSLLIQPFVENAIVHGMAHSDDKQLNLTVTATLEGNTIKYVIQDNGVGREKARIYNMQNKPYHKSVGLQITEERINIFNEEEKKQAIHIVDLYDENNNSGGTKVEITLKAM